MPATTHTRNEFCQYLDSMQEFLAKGPACVEARAWVGNKTAKQAWNQCSRADWMLWIVRRIVREQELKQEIVRIAADVARGMLIRMDSTDQHALDCVAAVDRWLAGEQVDLQTALKVADTGMSCVVKRLAGWAANAANAADHNGPAAAAYWANWTVTGARAYRVSDASLANIVRKHLPWTAIQPLLERAMQEVS